MGVNSTTPKYDAAVAGAKQEGSIDGPEVATFEGRVILENAAAELNAVLPGLAATRELQLGRNGFACYPDVLASANRDQLNALKRTLEGMLVAAWAVGVERIWIYLRDEYHAARVLLQQELAALHADPPVPLPAIELRRGAGAYICGEESALIESVEGKRGWPRLRPPIVAQVGVFGRPVAMDRILQSHDRVEVYRPLEMSPKEARRLRAKRRGAE